jgi:glyoxylase-like metal-dependent hydrolase (beta-lactamase superfamily II)
MAVTRIEHHIDQRLHWWHSEDVDCFGLVAEKLVVLFDTFMTSSDCAAALADLAPFLATRTLLVINSHQHNDHVWGNGALPAGTTIIGHSASHEIANSSEVVADLRAYQAKDARFADVCLVAPTLTFAGTLQLHAGDLTLCLLPALGHARDQLVLWCPELRLLLAADAAEWPWPYAAQATDLPILRQTLSQLQELQPQWVLPCHGGSSNASLLQKNLDYFDELERHTRAGQSWSYENALAWLAVTEPVADFYREFHQRNSAALQITSAEV